METVAISSSGYAYVLTSSGTIYGHSILRVDPTDGTTLGGAAFGGFDVAIDDTNYAIWIVGADVKKLNIFLEQECALDPVEWTAVSVDFDSSGSIWIAERKHS